MICKRPFACLTLLLNCKPDFSFVELSPNMCSYWMAGASRRDDQFCEKHLASAQGHKCEWSLLNAITADCTSSKPSFKRAILELCHIYSFSVNTGNRLLDQNWSMIFKPSSSSILYNSGPRRCRDHFASSMILFFIILPQHSGSLFSKMCPRSGVGYPHPPANL